MSNIIEVKNLTKKFDKTIAVNKVSFVVREGEILGFLGPNGAGKTTTIQMLLGLLEPTSGSVKIFGKDIAKDRQVILQRVNFSSAYIIMPYNLTVQESLTVFGHLYQVPNLRAKITELITLFDLADIKNTLVGKLSSGQQTRLNLAKAFINDPEILFLDEPTASLDPVVAHKVRALLKDLHRRHKLTILYTSHNMAEVRQIVDRVIFLDHGAIVAQGSPANIARRHGKGDLEQAFIELTREAR